MSKESAMVVEALFHGMRGRKRPKKPEQIYITDEEVEKMRAILEARRLSEERTQISDNHSGEV